VCRTADVRLFHIILGIERLTAAANV